MSKEPRIFKTLVHKETGEWGWVNSYHKILQKSEIPNLYPEFYPMRAIEHNIEIENYDLKEVVLLTKEEYEKLKGGIE